MGALLGLGLMAMLLLSGAEKKGAKKRPGEVPKGLPPEQGSAFMEVMGRLMYRAEVALGIINSLLYKALLPTDQPNLAMVHPGPGVPIGENQWGAWFGAKGLHDQGFDLWVPTNAHVPVALPWPVLFLQPGDPVPTEGFALLISADEQWPARPAV